MNSLLKPVKFRSPLRHGSRGCTRFYFLPAIAAWIAALGALAIPQSRAAQLITVNGTITVNADDGASFKAGDSFTYSFTFNDATTDTASQTFSGQFNAGVSAFSLARDVSNTGTWDPAGGTFTVSPLSNMNLNANSDLITLQARGSGFPDLNGVAFFDVGLSFGFSGVYDFVDTGSGQTFAQMVGVSPLDFTLASSQFAEIRNINYESPSLSASVTIPEPSTIVSLGGGGVMLWIMTGRRRAALRNRRPPARRC
ncbi:MAG: PEP-CTERM sorting domain-containing protein [Luteolibacter sp.]